MHLLSLSEPKQKRCYREIRKTSLYVQKGPVHKLNKMINKKPLSLIIKAALAWPNSIHNNNKNQNKPITNADRSGALIASNASLSKIA